MAWWSNEFGGLVGGGVGILGALAGIIGAAIGVLAPRGKCKGLVVGVQCAVAAIGCAGVIVGIVAVVMGQPYHVWYPLVLGGGILALVMGGLLPLTLSVYRQAERRRMDAESLRRS